MKVTKQNIESLGFHTVKHGTDFDYDFEGRCSFSSYSQPTIKKAIKRSNEVEYMAGYFDACDKIYEFVEALEDGPAKKKMEKLVGKEFLRYDGKF